MELFILWIVCIFIGGLIGSSKGQEWSGIIWPLLLGPLGVIIVLCLPNLVKQQAALEEKQRQLKLIQLQEAQLCELRALRQPPAPEPVSPSPPSLPSPPSRETPAPALEDFIPDNLVRARMSRRR